MWTDPRLHAYLPTSRPELESRAWDELDVVLVSGDAYVDHPSFAAALIGRVLEAEGFRVGIIDQPDWRSTEAFKALGRPRLFFGVTSGNLDSMVANHTATRKQRSRDYYSPGGAGGKRPDRAVTVYCNRVREAFPGVPIVIGGLEASLRRLAHYDYWTDKLRRSLLMDTRADLLVFGMGEHQILEIARRLRGGAQVGHLTDIRGTAFRARRGKFGLESDAVLVGEYEEMAARPDAYARAFKATYDEQDAVRGRAVVEGYGDWIVVENPPARALDTQELDAVYELPYARTCHPKHAEAGGVPALDEVQFSVTAHRGCFGACSFCSLIMHQGRVIQSRSTESVVREVVAMTQHPDWRGVVSDVGGPSANFHVRSCEEQTQRGCCKGKECLYPHPCARLNTDHSAYVDLLRRVRAVPGVKRVFVRSGVRYDYALLDKTSGFINELCAHHVSGQLKVAPEHVSSAVLRRMRKPGREVYERFVQAYDRANAACGKTQYLVPYLISGHPGSRLEDMAELAEFTRDMGHRPEQVQEFTPTPMTAATCMYYSGIDPFTGDTVHVARDAEERRLQRALLQHHLPENRGDVIAALRACGRDDLIGTAPRCLVEGASHGRPSPGHQLNEAGFPSGRQNPGGRRRGKR